MAKHTYFEFIPELKELVGEQEAQKLLEKHFKPVEGHDWYFNGLNAAQIEAVRKGYEERYGKGAMK